MITGGDIYNVLSAVTPLYVAMFLAYGSVKWNIFSPDQCSGINKFVAAFAVPLLSFEFICKINPYSMNLRFFAADVMAKVIVLVALCLWAKFDSRRGSIDWIITNFSLSTLPNTLVMGIPLLKAMYGQYTQTLMVQTVVMQCILWYTLLLFLYEYRSAKILINEQFPETANSIASFRVQSDVLSLDETQLLQTDAQIGEDGKIHVTVKKSSEFGSVSSSSQRFQSALNSLQSSGNWIRGGDDPESLRRNCSSMNATCRVDGGSSPHVIQLTKKSSVDGTVLDEDANELHVFVWSSSGSTLSDRGVYCLSGSASDYGIGGSSRREAPNLKDERTIVYPNGTANCHIKSSGMDCSTAESNERLREEESCGGNGGEFIDAEFQDKDVLPMIVSNSSESVGTILPLHAKEQKSGSSSPPAYVMINLILSMVWRKLLRNPNVYASILGLIWSFTSYRWHIEMPKILEGSITILSDAGLGMAMFSLGLFMALRPRIIACGWTFTLVWMLLRFIVGPATMALASILVGLRHGVLRVAIVQAALPQGIVPFVFAREYNLHPDILSTAVIFGMIVSLPITLVYYLLLGL